MRYPFHPTLALTTRTLRQDIRAFSTHVGRAMLLLFVLWMLFEAATAGGRFAAPGLKFFSMILILNLWFISLAGVTYFGSTITEEKEQKTIGLLRMAGVNSVSLLLGKGVPRFVTSGLLLLAQVPFVVLAITLGGVTLHQIIAAYVALAVYLLAIGSLGLFCSVVARTGGAAALLAGMIVVASLVTPFLISAVTPELVRGGYLTRGGLIPHMLDLTADYMGRASIVTRCQLIMQTGFSLPIIGWHFLMNIGFSAVAFVCAWSVFDRYTVEEKCGEATRSALTRPTARARWIRTGRTWKNAIAWKEYHFTCGGRGMVLLQFVVFVLLIGVFAACSLYFYGEIDWQVAGGVLVGGMLVAIVVAPVGAVACMFGNEIRDGTLTNLVLLPHSTWRLVWQKAVGFAVGVIPFCCFLLLGLVISWLTTKPNRGSTEFREMSWEPEFWGYLGGAIIVYIAFLHLVALFSLMTRSVAIPLAIIATIVFFVAVPILGESFFAASTIFSLVSIPLLQVAISERLRAIASR